MPNVKVKTLQGDAFNISELDNDGNVIPEYYIDRMEFSDDSGLIAIIETFAALSANPMVMLDLPEKGQNVRINMSDSSGNIFHAE